jgi:hypothetical protein
MPKAIEVQFDDGHAVTVPVDDVRWLAGELRRSRSDPLASIAAAVLLERAVEDPHVAPNVVFTNEEAAAVVALLRRRHAELSQPLRGLHDGLREELEG